jgi:hypothetical protein
MKFKSIVGSAILSFFLLASCNSQSSITQTPSPITKSTLTNSPDGTTTINFKPTHYATLSPDDATEVYFRFTAIPATIQARGAKCKEGFELEQGLYVLDASTDQWTLFTCSPVPADRWTPGVVDFGTRYTQIIKTDLSKTWTIQHNTFDYSIINRPDAFMGPYRWTADGKYLYLHPRYYPGSSGGPMSTLLRDYKSDLYRINLETGEFKLVLQKEKFDAISLSPNDQYLMYSQWDEPDVIHMMDTESGKDLQVKLNENLSASGNFVWNTESTFVIFIGGYEYKGHPSGEDVSSTSIFVLTLKNMLVQKILSEDSRAFVFSDCFNNNNYWLDEQTICLSPLNDEESGNNYFTINIKTGKVLFLRPFLDPTATFTPNP